MHLRVGEFKIDVLHEGCFWLDGGAMFGVVPRVVWEKCCPPDAKNRIRMGLNQLLVRGPGFTALIDTGMGDKFDAKSRAMYGVESLAPWSERLNVAGITTDDITHVVLTHLHFDHGGGSTCLSADGREVVPVFANAEYIVQETEWQDATHPHERNRASYLFENYLPLHDTGRLRLINGDQEILPGVRCQVTGGHSRGHQAISLRSAGAELFFPGDLFPTRNHLRVAWNMGYDLFPIEIVEARRSHLRRLIDTGTPVLFEHDAEPEFCRIKGTVEKPEIEILNRCRSNASS